MRPPEQAIQRQQRSDRLRERNRGQRTRRSQRSQPSQRSQQSQVVEARAPTRTYFVNEPATPPVTSLPLSQSHIESEAEVEWDSELERIRAGLLNPPRLPSPTITYASEVSEEQQTEESSLDVIEREPEPEIESEAEIAREPEIEHEPETARELENSRESENARVPEIESGPEIVREQAEPSLVDPISALMAEIGGSQGETGPTSDVADPRVLLEQRVRDIIREDLSEEECLILMEKLRNIPTQFTQTYRFSEFSRTIPRRLRITNNWRTSYSKLVQHGLIDVNSLSRIKRNF